MDRSGRSPEEFDAWAAPEPPVDVVAEPGWLSGPTEPVSGRVTAPERIPATPADPGLLRRRRGTLLAFGVVVAVGGTVAVTGIALNAASPESAAVATTVEGTPTPAAAVWCEGLGPGVPAAVDSDDPGVAAIAAFEYAYYVIRDGARAREHVAPDARVGSAEQIATGIAQIPVGTTHCVLAKKATDGVYAVDVFERRPDGGTEHYQQTILTTSTPGGSLITAITGREN